MAATIKLSQLPTVQNLDNSDLLLITDFESSTSRKVKNIKKIVIEILGLGKLASKGNRVCFEFNPLYVSHSWLAHFLTYSLP